MGFLAAVVQLTSTEDVARSLDEATALVDQAAKRGARLVALPENLAFMGDDTSPSRPREALDGRIPRELSALARRHQIELVAGSFPEASAHLDRTYNTCVAYGPEGQVRGIYRKIHLFDVALGEGATHRESSRVEAGSGATLVETPLGVLGLSICYDLRFGGLYRALARAGAEIFTVPAAFTVPTGRDHWEILLRARAIEHQAFVLAPAQFGAHTRNRRTYGRSMIIDPWGTVLATCPDRPSVAVAEIDLERMRTLRAALPTADHERPHAYVVQRCAQVAPPSAESAREPSSVDTQDRANGVAAMGGVAAPHEAPVVDDPPAESATAATAPAQSAPATVTVTTAASTTTQPAVLVIGAGLAGCEVALQLAARGIQVRLMEMKPGRRTPAQHSDDFAELVCSNSLRAAGLENAVGVLKEEMRRAGGALIQIADDTAVPAGGALAVDRGAFGARVTEAVRVHPLIEVVSAHAERIPPAGEYAEVVVATGPLTSEALAQDLTRLAGDGTGLYFYDAIAPIVSAESIDTSIVFAASRYGKGDGDDYLNCPLDQDTYERFVRAVIEAEKVTPHNFEEARYFEGCLPLEVVAERGRETLRHGCMKPVGLRDPRRPSEVPYAVVQLRAENRARTAYNLVGFQTRMTWSDQVRVLRMIPGLEQAEFLRLGSIHRNTYLDAPRLLDEGLRLRAHPHVRFAGQITGVEGYVESMASGLFVSWMIAANRLGHPVPRPPATTTLGALLRHTLGEDRSPGAARHGHVPSNIHWGHCPPLDRKGGRRDRRRLMAERALVDLEAWLASTAWLRASNDALRLPPADRAQTASDRAPY